MLESGLVLASARRLLGFVYGDSAPAEMPGWGFRGPEEWRFILAANEGRFLFLLLVRAKDSSRRVFHQHFESV